MLQGLLLSPLAVPDMAAAAHDRAPEHGKSEGSLNLGTQLAGRWISLLFAHFSPRGHARSAVSTRSPSDCHPWKGNCERSVQSA